MPTELIVPPERVDAGKVLLDEKQVKELLQQRYEFLQITRVLEFDRGEGWAAGLNRVPPDAFWVRGHIPGRPVMPGVMMIETAAQMATVHIKLLSEDLRRQFFGFKGADAVKFRKQVLPGQDLIMVTRPLRIRSRAFSMAAQGFVEGALAFEGTIEGIQI